MTQDSDGHVASTPKGMEQPVSPGRPLIEHCRCHRPLSSPDGRHWWPYRDAEPGPEVQVVALYGDEPGFLRMERVDRTPQRPAPAVRSLP